ncbi:prolactin-inducible protein [Rattus rattus]|uniref:prolactin-inducible protein n=1 Tax=Rattus rattus TaxID=10117 RepID=UPI0013F2DE80|nr:prolactin-inducible protein [Rattus rattus]
MQGLSFTSTAATFFLVLCLQLGINEGQDNGAVPQPLLFQLNVPSTPDENQEVDMSLTLQTQYKECLVVKVYLVSNTPVDGGFNYIQTRCICNDHPTTLYWNFEVTQTLTFRIMVDIVKDKGICPDNVAVVPISGDRYYTDRTVYVN